MLGKYSPTVSAAYQTDQEWHDRLTVDGSQYDPDGFDSYGYNEDGFDRAGNHEDDYMNGRPTDWNEDVREGEALYNEAYNAWTFDGTRPVRR
jgi:hypothetical protein